MKVDIGPVKKERVRVAARGRWIPYFADLDDFDVRCTQCGARRDETETGVTETKKERGGKK